MRGMKPLPMPLRLAAGLVATAIEEVQELPRKLVELPVTAVSQVLQASMRMQQRVTELAIKGDQALGGLRPVPETPTWARFDEDEIDTPYSPNGPFGGGMDHPFGSIDRSYGGGNGVGNGVAGVPSDTDWNVPPPRSPRTVSPIRIARDPEPGALDGAEDDFGEFEDLDFSGPTARTNELEPPAGPEPGTRPSARTAAARPPSKPATEAPATKPPAKPPTKPDAGLNGSAGSSAAKAKATKSPYTKATKSAETKSTKAPKATKDAKATTRAKPTPPPAAQTGPKGHEDYPTWTLPQLRGRFRSLELRDVQALLDWETSHLDRPPYVTMLSNRIASIKGR